MKSKLGISVGLLGAAIFCAALFSGSLLAVILAGYVLMFETNEWLRKSAVKAVVIVFGFSFLSAIVGLIPNAFTLINDVLAIIKVSPLSINVLNSLVSLVQDVLSIGQKLLLLVLIFKAMNQGTVSVGPVDRIVDNNVKED